MLHDVNGTLDIIGQKVVTIRSRLFPLHGNSPPYIVDRAGSQQHNHDTIREMGSFIALFVGVRSTTPNGPDLECTLLYINSMPLSFIAVYGNSDHAVCGE